MEQRKGVKYDERGYRLENFDDYKPRKWYIEPEDEDQLERSIQDKENELKKFKYHEDFAR